MRDSAAPTTDAEAAVCQRFAGRIRAYGFLHLRDHSQADDLVQHVLLAVVQAMREGRIEAEERIENYIFGTCRNAVMTMRRATTRQQRIADETAKVLPDGYELKWQACDARQLERCLLALDARERAIVLASYVEERSADDIGRSMELAPGNVRVIRHRAIGRLQTCIERGP